MIFHPLLWSWPGHPQLVALFAGDRFAQVARCVHHRWSPEVSMWFVPWGGYQALLAVARGLGWEPCASCGSGIVCGESVGKLAGLDLARMAAGNLDLVSMNKLAIDARARRLFAEAAARRRAAERAASIAQQLDVQREKIAIAARVLGVTVAASATAIRAAYHHQALLLHPDRGGSHERMAMLNVARDVLLAACELTVDKPVD